MEQISLWVYTNITEEVAESYPKTYNSKSFRNMEIIRLKESRCFRACFEWILYSLWRHCLAEEWSCSKFRYPCLITTCSSSACFVFKCYIDHTAQFWIQWEPPLALSKQNLNDARETSSWASSYTGPFKQPGHSVSHPVSCEVEEACRVHIVLASRNLGSPPQGGIFSIASWSQNTRDIQSDIQSKAVCVH